VSSRTRLRINITTEQYQSKTAYRLIDVLLSYLADKGKDITSLTTGPYKV